MNDVWKHTWLIKTFSPLLFSAPDRYLKQLSNVTADDFLTKKKDWGQFIAALEKPWTDFILYVSTSVFFFKLEDKAYDDFRQQFFWLSIFPVLQFLILNQEAELLACAPLCSV